MTASGDPQSLVLCVLDFFVAVVAVGLDYKQVKCS